MREYRRRRSRSPCPSCRRESKLSASARLARKVGLVLPAYGAPLSLLLEHPRARTLYPRCLIVSYHISRSMVPLMEAALMHARARGPGDPVVVGLAGYLERHIPEEIHDDVPGDAVVDDLEALGLDPVDVRALPMTRQITELVAAQIGWMSEDHPVAILGFLELEAHNADLATVERLIEKTGLPREGFGQLLLHAKLDLVHAKELHRVLDELPLEPAHEQLIGLSALHTMSLVTEAFLDAMGDAAPATVAART
jgi:Iron-containing redox enzyme